MSKGKIYGAPSIDNPLGIRYAVDSYDDSELREVDAPRKGDPRFHKELKEIGELHDKKQVDYGTNSDPFANVRSSEEWGVPGWVGAMVRLNDKVHRLKQYVRNGSLANEGVVDSLRDIAVYALIAKVLYEENASKQYINNG